MIDNVIRPKHYTAAAIEPIEVIHAWDLNFDLGNVIKYIARAGKKRGNSKLQDVMKAQQYLAFEVARLQALERGVSGEDHNNNPTG